MLHNLEFPVYFYAGFYGYHLDEWKQQEGGTFKAVRAGDGYLPYLWLDGGEAKYKFGLFAHHASLYSTVDFKTATLIKQGSCHQNRPSVTLPDHASSELTKAYERILEGESDG